MSGGAVALGSPDQNARVALWTLAVGVVVIGLIADIPDLDDQHLLIGAGIGLITRSTPTTCICRKCRSTLSIWAC